MNPRSRFARPSQDRTSSRAIAFESLSAVLDRKMPLEDVLAESRNLPGLSQRDRAFARMLVATTLRRLGQIDRVIDDCLERPMADANRPVRHLLRLGVCQLLFLQTPAHAAVHATVALAEGREDVAGFKGLLNAVLRRVDRERGALLGRCNDPSLNTPPWLWASWITTYGADRSAEIAAAHLREPPLDLSVKGDALVWRERLGGMLLPTGSLRTTTDGAVDTLPGFAEGAWWVQDAAAALPARLLGPIAGRTVIDLCAAPGGKTAQLVAAGAAVTAVDRSASRLERLRANLARLELDAAIIVADATAWRPREPADAVLLDAPCSATGTIRRHPDVPWLKAPADIAKLASLQDRLLCNAIDMARPGGLIVYCTCSLQPEEGPDRIAALLAGSAPVARVPIDPSEVGGLRELVSADGDLRSLPCHLAGEGGMDGFYAARLRRR